MLLSVSVSLCFHVERTMASDLLSITLTRPLVTIAIRLERGCKVRSDHLSYAVFELCYYSKMHGVRY